MNAVTIFYKLCLGGLVFFPGKILSQRPVELSHRADQKGNFVFSALNKTYCPYVVHLTFTSLSNGRSDHELPFTGEVRPGSSTIFKLLKINPSQELVFQYTVSMRKGCLYTTPQIEWPYILPVAPGKETQAYVTDTKTSDGTQLYAVRLRMKPGDTIFAARAGIVTGVDVGSSQNDAGAPGTEGWNAIEVFQSDSSFAEYGVIRKDGALVKPGQSVSAGAPLGLVGGDAYGRGSEARLSIYYYQGNTLGFLPIQFWTKGNGKGLLKHGGSYICEIPPAPPAVRPKPAVKKKTAQ